MIYDKIRRESKVYPGFYRGRVEDADDPLKAGRVKVRIRPMMHDTKITTGMLPWAVPAYPMMGGSGSGYGMFAIPRVGTEVWVFFEMGDPMQPVYAFEAPNKLYGLPADRNIDYPYGVIWQTKEGMKFYVDRTIIKLTHKSGTTIDIDTDGTITIHGVKKINVDAADDITIDAAKDVNISVDKSASIVVGEDATIDVTGDVDLTGDNVTIVGNKVSINP